MKWLNQLVVEVRNKEGETHHDCWTGRHATAVTFGDFAERSCENRSFSRKEGRLQESITQSCNEDGAGYRDRKLEQRMVRPKPIKDRL